MRVTLDLPDCPTEWSGGMEGFIDQFDEWIPRGIWTFRRVLAWVHPVGKIEVVLKVFAGPRRWIHGPRFRPKTFHVDVVWGSHSYRVMEGHCKSLKGARRKVDEGDFDAWHKELLRRVYSYDKRRCVYREVDGDRS